MPSSLYGPSLLLELFHLDKIEGNLPTYCPPYNVQPFVKVESNQTNNYRSLRVSFNIHNYAYAIPSFGYGEIVVYNANRDNFLSSILLTNDQRVGVRLSVGYEGSIDNVTIFNGFVVEALDSYRQPNDEIHLYCQFIDDSVQKGLTLKRGSSLLDAVREVISEFNSIGQCPIFSNSVNENNFFPRSLSNSKVAVNKDLTLYGSFANIISKLESLLNIQVLMDSSSITVYNREAQFDIFGDDVASPILIDFNNGLVGSPTFHVLGSSLSFTSVLNPLLAYSSVIKLVTSSPILQGPGNSPINISNSRIHSGYVFPKNITHRGDTRDREWYTDIIANNVSAFIGK